MNLDIYIRDTELVFEGLKKGIIPESMPDSSQVSILDLDFTNPKHQEVERYRFKYIKEVGFARITKNWVRPLSKWIGNRKCLEIMSGSGALTYALREEGTDIIATDDFSWESKFNRWVDVEDIDCLDAIEKYGQDVDIIICSWPYMDGTAYKALELMREVNPDCLMIYIGEGYGGCTADEDFFDSVIDVDDDKFYDSVRAFTKWRGLHDYPKLLK